jgi:hypothetical protein
MVYAVGKGEVSGPLAEGWKQCTNMGPLERSPNVNTSLSKRVCLRGLGGIPL